MRSLKPEGTAERWEPLNKDRAWLWVRARLLGTQPRCRIAPVPWLSEKQECTLEEQQELLKLGGAGLGRVDFVLSLFQEAMKRCVISVPKVQGATVYLAPGKCLC